MTGHKNIYTNFGKNGIVPNRGCQICEQYVSCDLNREMNRFFAVVFHVY